MRKLKLLFTGLALVGGVLSANAQTDVTSTYLTNADFSGDHSPYDLPSGNTALSSRYIYQPAGWDISVKNKNAYNYSVVKDGDVLQTTDFNSEPYKPGDGRYMVRFRNGNNENEHITLSQTFTISPGVYDFSAYLIREDGSKIDVTFSAAGSSISNNSAGAWQTKTFEKVFTTSTEITVTLKFSNKATSGDNKKRAGADNVKIEYKKNVNGETLAALIAQATSINTRTGDLTSAISTAQGVYDNIDDTPDYQDDIDGAITALRSAITTSLGCYAGLDGTGDDVTAFIANAGFETSPIFDGTSNGTSGSANAVATSGSTTLYNSVNAYYVPGWELKTTETSDYARSFTMPYNNTLYVQSNAAEGGQAIASPTNESSVTTSNDYLLAIQTSWCPNAINAIEQTIPLPAGSYRLTFDSYVGTTLSNASSLCGISYGATPTTDYRWPSTLNTWTANVIDFELAAQTNVTFSLGYKKTADQGAGNTPVLFVDNLKLTYYTALGIAQAQWQDVHDALAALNANVLPTAAKNAINTELAKSVPTTSVDDVNNAKDALQALIDSYDDIKTAYDKVNELITLATNEVTYSAGNKTDFSTAISTATTNKEERTDADDLDDDYDTLESARQTYVTSGAEPYADHPFECTFKITNPGFEADGKETNSPTGWTIPNKGAQYGAKNRGSVSNMTGSYMFNNWQSWWQDCNVEQTIPSLPKGRYEVTAVLASYNGVSANLQAGGGSTDSNMTGENNGIRVSVNGDVTGSSLTIRARAGRKNDGSLLRADDFTLSFIGLKPVLNDLISSATTLSTSNIGTGVFQIPSSAATTLTSAIETAQGVYDDASKYGDDIQDAIDDLNDAIDVFKATELNTPTDGKRYKLTLADRGTLTYQTSSTEGGYGFPFMTSGDHMAQTFILTQVSGNNYTICFEDFDGNTRYICTRAQYGEGGTGTAGIRSFVEGEEGKDALQVTIQASSTDNVFYMLNTERDNAKLGSNGGDFYTDNTYTSWSISEASQASVPVTIADGVNFATRIFPFTPTLPSGVIAYSCAAKDGEDYLTLSKVDAPEANVPYILYAESGSTGTLTGYGTATADTYTTGWLTGVYTPTLVPVNSYVLQNNKSDGVAFYKVAEGEQPTVNPYRCYLTDGGVGGARALYFNFDETNAVETIKALTAGKNTIYNAAGKVVPSLQKGLNIIKMSDGSIRKVMVK